MKTDKVLRTLGNKNCNKALRMLERKKMNVVEVQKGLRLSQPATSQTLGKLRKIGAVKFEQDGRQRIYQVDDLAMLGILHMTDRVTQQGSVRH